MILNGRIYRGARGIAGEFGHIKVKPGGRLCGCGEKGCLEAYAGGHNIGAQAAELMAQGRATSLVVPAGLKPTASMVPSPRAQASMKRERSTMTRAPSSMLKTPATHAAAISPTPTREMRRRW